MRYLIIPLFFLSFIYQSTTQEYLKLIEPKDGSVVKARKQLTIKWEGHEIEEGFTIEFSSDGGNNWEVIDSNVVGDEYKWLTPNENLENCKIRVSQKEFDYVEQEWEKSFGGDGIESVNHIISTSDGGYLVSLNTFSNIILGHKRIGGGDLVIIKLNEDFEIEWSKLFGGTKGEYIYDVVEFKDSEYSVVVISESDDNIFEKESGIISPWVLTVDHKGDILKIKNYPSIIPYSYFRLLKDEIGEKYLIGTSNRRLNVEKLNNFDGIYGIAIDKLDNKGNIEWTKVYGDGKTNNRDYLYLYDAIPNHYGGFTMSGTINFGSFDIYTIATDSDDNVVWTASTGGWQPNSPYRIIERNGETYIAGITSENNPETNEPHIGKSGYLIKYDSEGKTDWTSVYSRSWQDAFYDMTIDDENNIFTSGFSILEHPDTNISNTQSYMTKHSSDGKLQWIKNIDSPDSYLSVVKHIEVEDGFVLLGNSIVHDPIFTDEYDSDIKLIRMKNTKYVRKSAENENPFSIQTPSSVKNEENWGDNIEVKVNIIQEAINIRTSKLVDRLEKIIIYDNSGRQLYSLSDKSKLANNNIVIELNNFKTGIYYISFNGDEINYTKKISIVR